jgi:hypothetical protein
MVLDEKLFRKYARFSFTLVDAFDADEVLVPDVDEAESVLAEAEALDVEDALWLWRLAISLATSCE